MDNEMEFLKEWHMVPSDDEEKPKDHGDNNIDSSSNITESEVVESKITESETLAEGKITERETCAEGNITESETLAEDNITESESHVEGNITESNTPVEGNIIESETLAEDNVTENKAPVKNNITESETLIEVSITERETLIGSTVQEVIDQEAAINESSSSDIDIIDENAEECVTSCVLPPSSLTISPSIENSCIPSSSESSSVFISTTSESTGTEDHRESVTSAHGDRNDNERRTNDTWTFGGRPLYDWLCLILEFLHNMSGIEWGVVLAVTVLLYVNINIHQTNTIGLEKEDVISQMKYMINELKHDNKLLKNQMLSEIKNEKALSSFEHQIRELKKENSKLSRMLRDVVSVLQKQKNSQEKKFNNKEADYEAPFKNEINKLKEHINILKFDNEELQKQLVRMRYASYSQGGKQSDTKDKDYEKKKEKHDNANKESVINKHFDIEHLKKWNDLVTLLAKELGISDEKEHTSSEEPHSNEKVDSKTEIKYDWGWKMLKRNFKETLNFPNINISDIISKYMKYNVQTMADLYDTINNYFSSAQAKTKEALDSFKETKEKTEMLKILNGLNEYWAQMKNKYFKTFAKKTFQSATDDFKTSESPEDLHSESDSKNSEENIEQFEIKTNVPFESNDKIHNEQSESDRNKWVFKRAEYRARHRNDDDDSTINWFLRRGKEFFEGKTYTDENDGDMFAEE